MDFTSFELAVIKGLLNGVMQHHNILIEKGHYFAKEKKEVYEIIESILGKMEESE